MRKRFRALLVYGFALTAMTYAIWQADIPILPVASADWGNGCCLSSDDCGRNFICWNKPGGWADCRIDRYFDSECQCWQEVARPNYCNPPGQRPDNEGKGPGSFWD